MSTGGRVQPSLASQEFMEYDKLKQMLDYAPSNGMYEELMAKEASVLDTINRVVDHSNKRQIEADELVNVPAKELAQRFGSTVKDMYDELYGVKTGRDFVEVFTKSSDRWIYAGFVIVCVSLFLYFVSVTN